jgi:HEAT repeat protein
MRVARWALLAVASLMPLPSAAQVNYIARFEMEKPEYLLGEPIFSKFTIRNAGSQTFQFVSRPPSRALNRELESEPRFRLTDAAGRPLLDPAPKPCGGATGTVVYGSVTLAPGQTHTERWLLNQWARFTSPGRYYLRAERRLPLLALDPRTQELSKKPAAYALALDELTFEIVPAAEARLRSAFQPFLETLRDARNSSPAEAVLVVTTLPKAFFFSDLEAMASPSAAKCWDRRVVLEGMARLGTPAAWKAILSIAQGREPVTTTDSSASADTRLAAGKDDSLRAYAILLLAEKGDAAFLPALLDMVATGPEGLRDDALRDLGFFQDPRAIQALYKKLHSNNSTDRMNAILGLRNLGSKETIPALMAMLNDPEPPVRQVANFALQGLTGEKFRLSEKASREESARAVAHWHAWWREKGGNFVPTRPPPCREW